MPHYIRFLKPPKLITSAKTKYSVSALITITTDLGESFLPEDADLVASVYAPCETSRAVQKAIKWHAGNRDLGITLDLYQHHYDISEGFVVLDVKSTGTSENEDFDFSCAEKIPPIVPVRSLPFGGSLGLQAPKLIERSFKSDSSRPELRIREDTGNTVSRHIWCVDVMFCFLF